VNHILESSLLAGAVSFLVTLLIVASASHHSRFSADSDLSGPQKLHARPVPRIGGLSVALAYAASLLWMISGSASAARDFAVLLACAVPAFGLGLLEDITKRVSARKRLVATMASAGLAVYFLGAVLHRADLPGFDAALSVFPIAVVITLLAVGGTANAINIIDGLNGLASMCAMLMFVAIGYVAYKNVDMLVFSVAMTGIFAIAGFFVFNYPSGLVFLGDGGAYLIGFLLAESCVLLLVRNPQVSPMFALLVCAYPIFETLFSVYRRKVVRRVPSMAPDAIHLHSLVYRRLVRWAAGDRTPKALTRRNSMTSPFLWVLCLLNVLPAMIFWRNTSVLLIFLALFILTYLAMYAAITKFKIPKWMVIGK
jgi:UDP-N-acetylmuramyl pentapeptide phosphotransferase/UDP-N-acetylglucosamine-1-phosphate transferase